jgi:class 3 adenylate cyclase
MPAKSTPQERRTYNIMTISTPAGLLFHVFFIFLFSYWGIPQLAIANIFSSLLWVASILLLRSYKPEWTLVLIFFEVTVHTVLVIHFIGWGMGMQYFLIVLIMSIVLTMLPAWIRLTSVLTIVALFILLYYYALANAPQAQVDPLQLNIANVLITASALLLAASMMLYGTSLADRAEAQLAVEHEKSEDLLHNILPEVIAERLKESRGTIADQNEGASILFADVVNFTPMSAEMSATELVDLLNEVFSDFDDLTEKYGLEKIKTIGDCYMVASGVPEPRADHAQVITHMALDMQERVENHDYHGHKLAFRIGINSGPVVAGVIGRKKFIYDLWGDTVNTASRMESNGKGGCIQITETTYNLIKEDFLCEPQGTIHVKGKGEMAVWHVQKEKNSSPATI